MYRMGNRLVKSRPMSVAVTGVMGLPTNPNQEYGWPKEALLPGPTYDLCRDSEEGGAGDARTLLRTGVGEETVIVTTYNSGL